MNFYLDNGHKETPLWSPCMQIRSPGPPKNVKMLKKNQQFSHQNCKNKAPITCIPTNCTA